MNSLTATHETTLAGYPITLRRMGMQHNLNSTSPQDLWTEDGPIGRVEMKYVISASEQIQDINDFIDDSVVAETLTGDGPGKSADGRLKALMNMIDHAGDLIDAGDTSGACKQLLNAYERCDGDPKPPDFVSGTAATDLANLIQDLRASLGCN